MSRRCQILVCMVIAAVGCNRAKQSEKAPPPSSPFLKGQTHVHTANSPDSVTRVTDVVRFYRERGFDFIVITDHDFITRPPPDDKLIVVAGAELTQNLATCDPPPEPGLACLLHINGLFLERASNARVRFPPPTDFSRLAVYQRALDETARRRGIAQLNHPNMSWAVDAPTLIELGRRGVKMIEIANQAEQASNRGDETHPSVEALWDAALGEVVLWGVASDDAHHYTDAEARARIASGREAFVGNVGWIMVRADKNKSSIRSALSRGDFYSSTGVTLTTLESGSRSISVEILDDGTGPFTTTFIGGGGAVLAVETGLQARFSVGDGESRYVRARVENRHGKKAWTQPAF